jgi:DNA-binding transcriptional regulator YdaS (Cro superfamily)
VRLDFEKTWKLTDDECRNVLDAMDVMRARLGGWSPLARAMGVHKKTLSRVVTGETKASAGIAVRVARVARVNVGRVLSGEFARLCRCFACGQPMPSVRA